MKHSADHATNLVRKVKETEQEFARTKNIRDLTNVIKYDAEVKRVIKSLKVEPEKRRGIPIGQRWDIK
jgi:hypothetical protein